MDWLGRLKTTCAERQSPEGITVVAANQDKAIMTMNENVHGVKKIEIVQKPNPIIRSHLWQRSKSRTRWSPEIQHLVDWFLTSDLPTEQFWLEDGPYLRSIENPARFYKSIQRDIETGSGGSKMMRDNLVANLKALHNKFNGKIKDLNNGSN